MSITATVITRNHQETLEACLESLRDAVDEIVVVDTGSEDETVLIAKSQSVKVLHHSWGDDFAAARNMALDQARCTWILNLQPDECLSAESRQTLPQRLLQVSDTQPVLLNAKVFEPERQPIYAGRLFPNHPDIRYKGRAHEWPAWQGKWMDGIECPELVLHKLRSRPEMESTRLRLDSQLLRRVLAECEDAGERMVYYKHLGHDALALGQFEVALEAFKQGLIAWEFSGASAGALLQHLLLNLVKLALTLNRDRREIRGYSELLVKHFPDQAEGWLLHGQNLFWLGQNLQAEPAFARCLELSVKQERLAWQARQGLARLAVIQGRPETGIALLRVLYQQNPRPELAWHLCRAYTLIHALPSARHWYQLAANEPAPNGVHSLSADLADIPVWSPAEQKQLLELSGR